MKRTHWFRDPDADDFRIDCDSDDIRDQIDAIDLPIDEFDLDGDTEANDPIPFDLAGLPRIFNGRADFGAYEDFVDPCAADITGPSGTPDGVINTTDLLQLLADWGVCMAHQCPSDITPSCGDERINTTDLLVLLASWGPCGDPDPDSYETLREAAGITDEEHEEYLEVMQNGTQEQKDLWHCWYTWRIESAANPPGGPSPCSGEDPFEDEIGGGIG